MAVQTTGSLSSSRSRLGDPTKDKERRQKIILAVGAVILVIVLAVELPGMLSQPSSSAASAPAAATAATAAPTPASAAPVAPAAIPGLDRLDRLPAADIFRPLAGLATSTSGAGTGTKAQATVTLKGPPVRMSGFVVKDVFAAQVANASVATAGSPSATSSHGSSAAALDTGYAPTGGRFIVVIDTLPASTGAAAARRIEVAALNAGLKHVEILNAAVAHLGPQTLVALGPYRTASAAADARIRAISVGYPNSYSRPSPKLKPGA